MKPEAPSANRPWAPHKPALPARHRAKALVSLVYSRVLSGQPCFTWPYVHNVKALWAFENSFHCSDHSVTNLTFLAHWCLMTSLYFILSDVWTLKNTRDYANFETIIILLCVQRPSYLSLIKIPHCDTLKVRIYKSEYGTAKLLRLRDYMI